MKVSDASGGVTQSRQYDAWGRLEAGAGEPGHAFTGREWDPETGLYYYRARYYDPVQGRFIAADPVGFGAGPNFYAYVGNRPASTIDPSGLTPPDYDPDSWNGGGHRTTNNCYSYACNRREQPGRRGYKRQPGERAGRPIPPGATCEQIMAGARADGLKNGPKGYNWSCPCGYHLVKLYWTSNYMGSGQSDYHWYRQDSNGGWSSKHGWMPVDRQVPNPDWDAAESGYEITCGTMCAPD